MRNFVKMQVLIFLALSASLAQAEREGGGGFSYDNSRRILTQARDRLLQKLPSLTPSALEGTGLNREDLLALVTSLKAMPNRSALREAAPGEEPTPLMFDYHRNERTLEATKGFFEAYAGFGAELDGPTIRDVEKKILHETMHFSPQILNDDNLAEAAALRIIAELDPSAAPKASSAEFNRKAIIAKALARQLLEKSSGYSQAEHANALTAKAAKIHGEVERNLISSFNDPEVAARKLKDLDANPAKMAVAMVKDSYRDTNQFSEEELSALMNDFFERLPETKPSPSLSGSALVSAPTVNANAPAAANYGEIKNTKEFYDYLSRPGVDPAYAKYLIPGGIDHSAITANYDRYAGMRQDIRDQQAARVAALMAGQTDKYGILKIQFESDNFLSKSIAGFDAYASFSTDPAAYINAVKAAFSAPTGVTVSGYGKYQFDAYSNEDMLVTSDISHTKGGGVLIYVVADMNAETKVELLKAMSFRDIEDLASQIRKNTFQNWAAESRALNDLIQNLKSLPPDTLGQRLDANRGSVSMFEVALKLSSPEEVIANLPAKASDRIHYLNMAIDNLNIRLKAAQNKALDAKGSPDSQKEVDELQKGIQKAREILEKME